MPTYHPVEAFLVLECIDPTEYAALPLASQDGVKIILSCGMVNMAHDGLLYGYLSSIFVASPITLAAIGKL